MEKRKRIFFTLVSVLIVLTAWGKDAQQAVDGFANGGSVGADDVSVLIIDLSDGSRIGSHRAGSAMVPASVMKCVTTASLTEKRGIDWHYETPVYRTGPVRDGVLEGNIVVEGSGDPSLNSVRLKGGEDIVAEIVTALRKEGVSTVQGRIQIDESRFGGPAVNPLWASGDLSTYYGTGTHGFNFEDNASGNRSVSDPAGVFRSRLKGAMARVGISIAEEDIKNGRKTLLGTHRSLPADEIMRSCMMRSDNQFAEALLRAVSAADDGDGSVADGAAKEISYWRHKKLPLDEVKIVDGSGLSRSNRLTANFLGGVLEKMAGNPYYASFFPLAGQEGTLRKFLAGTELEGYVAMKTGSMRGIQCYAGYKLDDYYAPTHVIVVMINNMADRGKARAGVQKMLEEIFL